MVKQVNFSLDDEDHAKLLKAKGGMKWRAFVMQLAGDPSPVPQDQGNGSHSDERIEGEEEKNAPRNKY